MQFIFHFQNSLINQAITTMCDLEVFKNAEANSAVSDNLCCFIEAEVNLTWCESSSSEVTHTVLWSHSQLIMSRNKLLKRNMAWKG